MSDLDEAKRFYTAAFHWNFNDYGPGYAGIQSPEGQSVPEIGGLRVDGPYEFPGGRRFHFLDPSGNELGVWSEA